MKKLLLLIMLLFVLPLPAGIASAHRNTLLCTADNTIPAKTDRNNAIYKEIKEKYAELEAARNNTAQLYNEIKQQNHKNMTTKNSLKLEEKWNNIDSILEIQKQIKDIGNQNYRLIKKRLELQAKLSRAYLNKDTNAINTYKTQISDLNEKIKEKDKEAKIQRDNLRKAKEGDIVLWDKMKKANEKIKLLQSQMANLETEIYTLRTSKTTYWAKFYSAMRKNNLSDARIYIHHIKDIESQTHENLKGILSLKKEIETVLKTLE